MITYSDFTALVGFCDANATFNQISSLHWQAWLRLSRQPVTHVKGNDIAAVPRREATDTRRGIRRHTSTFPLSNVHLERPSRAPVQHKSADLVIVIRPVDKDDYCLIHTLCHRLDENDLTKAVFKSFTCRQMWWCEGQ